MRDAAAAASVDPHAGATMVAGVSRNVFLPRRDDDVATAIAVGAATGKIGLLSTLLLQPAVILPLLGLAPGLVVLLLPSLLLRFATYPRFEPVLSALVTTAVADGSDGSSPASPNTLLADHSLLPLPPLLLLLVKADAPVLLPSKVHSNPPGEQGSNVAELSTPPPPPPPASPSS